MLCESDARTKQTAVANCAQLAVKVAAVHLVNQDLSVTPMRFGPTCHTYSGAALLFYFMSYIYQEFSLLKAKQNDTQYSSSRTRKQQTIRHEAPMYITYYYY